VNPIGIYYAFLATSDTVDWCDCLEQAALAKADILEVSAPKLHMIPSAERKHIVDYASELNLELTMACALRQDADVSSADTVIHRAGVDLLKRDIDLAAEMNVGVIGGIITGVSKCFPDGIEYERERVLENSVRGLKAVAEHAGACGVVLGLEVANRFETPLVNTAQEALRVVNAIDHPSIGVHLDTFHMNIEEANSAKAIRLVGNKLVHFHACENNRALPGQRQIPWNEIFTALNEINYSGRIVIESLPGPYGTVASRLNIWRRLCENLDVELAQSIAMLRKEMEES
jgi:D-psicose/D-tagatose/L-ribulose 3-epimerase